MRIAVVSDIHGNRTAFDAVLADLRETSPDLIFHGGDLTDGGSSPAEIVDRIRELGWQGVAGNADQMLWKPEALTVLARGPLREAIEEVAMATREALGEERLAWLRALPLMQVRDSMALVHAAPGDLCRSPGYDASDDVLRQTYGSLAKPVAVYGHIHRPFIRNVGDFVIANSGSVSLSYTGDPCASYLLIDEGRPTIRYVKYDVQREMKLPNLAIDQTQVVASGTFATSNDLPHFCRVTATARPSKDSEIRMELWLPEENWNGRMEGTGNGGFAGHVAYASLAFGIKHGYAAVNTDMGMSTPSGTDASSFVGRPERWKDWGSRATHEMTVAAKELVKVYYGQSAKHSYFNGCSTGGQQALMEAEQFPKDYDGIVAGAPAHNRTGVHMSILWNFAAMEKDAASYIPATKLPALSKAVRAACAGEDGVILNPTKCSFDPVSLQCAEAESASCLTAAQVETARKLYQGPRNPRTGQQIYPGLPKGSEFAWAGLGADPTTAPQPPFAPIFKWVFGADWSWRSFDFDGSRKAFEAKLAGTLNATGTDLEKFRNRGGKLLLYHGWADWLVPPGETIRYYEAVAQKDQGKSVRLFLLPGVSHCTGGPGADMFDPLSTVVQWVENGTPPDKIETLKVVNGAVASRRAVCPYPQQCTAP